MIQTRPVPRANLNLTEISFGCAAIAGLYRACPEDQALATLDAAWAAGIRYFDTAPFYGTGLSEQRLGRFLRGKPRGEAVISTKVGRLLHPVSPGTAPDYGFVGTLPQAVTFDYTGYGILRSLDSSLQRLGLDRIDILYIHDIGPYSHGPQAPRHMADLNATGIPALERLKSEGVIKAWGLGVNEVQVCQDLMARAPIDIILMAGRYTLLDRRAEALLAQAKRDGTALVIGGVFNSGILATGPIAEATFDYQPASPEILAKVAALDRITHAAGSTLIAAALQFPLRTPAVASVLLGAADPASLRRNLTALRQPVPPETWLQIEPHTLR